jgi:sulfur-oxidizing protein SoxB
LEDVADNVFHPDPYLRQGGDMARVGGMTYTIAPRAKIGAPNLGDENAWRSHAAGKRYKVAGWAPVAEGAAGEPVWDVVARYLRSKRIVAARRVNQPKVLGVKE